MAESAIDRLKRLAREKKAAPVSPVTQPVEVQDSKPAETQQEMHLAVLTMKLRAASLQVDEGIKNVSENSTLETVSIESGEAGTGIVGSTDDAGKPLQDAGQATKETELDSSSTNIVTTGKLCSDPAVLEQINTAYETLNLTTGELTPTPSNHPLAMEFAELEAALLAADPDFRNQLRNVHRHLGKEPELVTMMTEQEIHMIIRGLVELANSEIVEPAKAKSVKKATADLKKKVISADDL